MRERKECVYACVYVHSFVHGCVCVCVCMCYSHDIDIKADFMSVSCRHVIVVAKFFQRPVTKSKVSWQRPQKLNAVQHCRH